MKIFFYCTWPESSNGYARIGCNIANYLAAQDQVEKIVYFGITRTSAVERFIHPKIELIDVYGKSPSKDEYGIDFFENVISEQKPDILFLYNDIMILTKILSKIESTPKTFKIFTYLDLVYKFENSQLINYINKHTDKFFVFSECWKNHMVHDLGIKTDKIFVLHHGIDTLRFFKIDSVKAKKHFGLDPDDFIFINMNRNTHRKAIDITIRAFLLFIKKHPNNLHLRLFLNGTFEPSSYPIVDILKIECQNLGLDFETVINRQILFNQGFLSDFELNYLYNACDVGINTCFGEGFGLCNLEHASLGKPQIVSSVGAFNDLFDPSHTELIEPRTKIYSPTALDSAGGYLEICDPSDFAKSMDLYYQNKQKRITDGEYYRNAIPVKYDWIKILSDFYNNHIKLVSNHCENEN
jgi:glycosyltransferase involved in cell wall biosynthesis